MTPMPRRPLVLLLAAVVALPALAQEAVPSAGGAGGGAPVAGKPPGPLDPPEAIAARGPDPIMGPCGPTAPDPRHPDRPDRKAHGEVFAGVGTHGYREAGGVVCQPIGDNAAVTIAIDAARIGRR